jgi:hypothetical protein
MNRATVIADASFCPSTRAAGWATWITHNFLLDGAPRTVRVKRFGTFHKSPKNSVEAEVWAAYNGIWLAYNRGAFDILCQTDCMAAIQRDHTTVRTKHWPEARVEFRHVKGHTAGEDARSWVNNWCDTHARKIMRQQRALR